jgi:hypothetical protein
MHGLVGAAAKRGREVMLHFAYGANMHRAIMRRHAPKAMPVGVASLADYRFIITADGYASVTPAAGHAVHGLTWRITPQDRVALDVWESLDTGLYRAETLPVHHAGEHSHALVYIARECPVGRPRAGYMELVIEAARALGLPPDYIASLEQWRPKGVAHDGRPRFGEFA